MPEASAPHLRDAKQRTLALRESDGKAVDGEHVEHLERVVRAPLLREQLGRAGKEHVRQNFLTPKRLEEVLPRVDEAKSIIGGTARALAEGALRFVLANDAVSTTIPGSVAPAGVRTAPRRVDRDRRRVEVLEHVLRVREGSPRKKGSPILAACSSEKPGP